MISHLPNIQDNKNGVTLKFKEKVSEGEAILQANKLGYIHTTISVDNSGKYTKVKIR